MEKRINIFLGNYGSGKTEISLNVAQKLEAEGKEVLLMDMDIVNPYFRSSEFKNAFSNKNIELVAPTYANTAVDLPTLSPMVYKIDRTDKHVVVDCGGDPAGATAMGFLSNKFEKLSDEMDVFFVMNTLRPLQENAQAVIEMMNSIEHVSHIKINKIIVNSNISIETNYKHLIDGVNIAKQVCEAKDIDIAYISGKKEVLEDYKMNCPQNEYKLLEIDIKTRPAWMDI